MSSNPTSQAQTNKEESHTMFWPCVHALSRLSPISLLILRSFTGCKAQTSQLLPWILTLQKMGQSVFFKKQNKKKTSLLPISCRVEKRKKRAVERCQVHNEMLEWGVVGWVVFLFSSFQAVSINKAINTQEVAVKEKHARNILILSACGEELFVFFSCVCRVWGLHECKTTNFVSPHMWMWCWCTSNCSFYIKPFYQTLSEHQKVLNSQERWE